MTRHTMTVYFMNASHRFVVMLPLMCKTMLIHHHTHATLLESVILVLILKDNIPSLRNSENYRCITLCCALDNVIDIWIKKKHDDVRRWCDLQFAVKECYSNVMCTTMINHYSEVYVCLLDVSKAFHRVEYGRFFQLLQNRKLTALID